MKRERPTTWDAETDVVCIGSGIGGLAAAIAAHDHGAKAIVLERAPDVGGVTAYSFGEVWVADNHLARAQGIEDSVESGAAYLNWMGSGFTDPAHARNLAVHGKIALKYFEEKAGLRLAVIDDFADYFWPDAKDAARQGRFLEPEPFPAASLGEWQTKTRTSPHVPFGMTHKDMFGAGGMANFLNWDFHVMAARLGNDERCLGPGLIAYFVKAALDRNIPLITGANVDQLITDDSGRVIGVAAKKDGKDYFVKAKAGVVIAVSGYDGNLQFGRTLDQTIDAETMLGPDVGGAHLELAGALGAQVARVPHASQLGFAIPGEEIGGKQMWRVALPEMGVPHALVVNQKGRRFGDESFYRTLGFAVDYIDGADQRQPNYPCWIILDSQARAKYPFGSLMPGQEMPQGMAIKADSLEELARQAGIDQSGLFAEIEKFNGYCATGVDADFARGERPWSRHMCGDPNSKPNPNLGVVLQPPFYAVPLKRISSGGVAAAGLLTNLHCQALDYKNRPIAGLYVAGNSVARVDMGAGMQSGLSNARGMVHGYLAGRHAAGKPSEAVVKG